MADQRDADDKGPKKKQAVAAMTGDRGETPTSPVPSYMAERFQAWRATRYASDRAWYAQLAEAGQHPRAMVIACCDSRVDVHGLLGAQPGDIFMVRNVANLCPPYEPDHEHHGTSAAIEFAVTSLKVAHILVLGHAHCGGVAAFMDRRDGAQKGESNFIDRWMDILEPGYQRLQSHTEFDAEKDEAARRKGRLRVLEQEAVLCSLRNLHGFPFVRDAVKAGKLTLHGAWFDIAEGALYGFDPATQRFAPL